MTDKPELQTAFEELNAVVTDLVARGRQPLLQGVKPALQVRTNRAFDERALGFATFLDFVRAAEQAGFVSTQPVPGGRRIDPRSPTATTPTPKPQIRRDLWAAFTDWSGRRGYAWDVDREFVETPRDDESETPIGGRSGSRLVPIMPISEATNLSWAREFIEKQPADPFAQVVRTVLEAPDATFVRFALVARADSEFVGAWRAFRVGRIADAIRTWAARHALDVDPYSPVESTPSLVDIRPVETELPHGSSRESTDHLRTAIKRAIDKMSPAELRELRLPVGSLEGTGL